MKLKLLLPTLVFYAFALHVNAQTTTNLNPSADNSIYSENNNSNGQGNLFCGNTNRGFIRRALLKFDLSSIPNNAIISSVTLTLTVNRSGSNASAPETHTIHELTKDWGEGTSAGPGQGAVAVAPDATWNDAMLGTSAWTNAGGDFDATAASSVDIASMGSFTFPSTSNFVSLAQSWLNNPSSNFGVILIGVEPRINNSRRFDSRESTSNPPQLSVTWTTSLSANEFALSNYFSITPNPAKNNIQLELPNAINKVNISIYDALGKEISTSRYFSKSKIDISSFRSGVYFLQTSILGVTKTRKFIKL